MTGQKLCSPVRKKLSCLIQLYLAIAPDKERDSHQVLQLFHGFADGGLCDVNALCCRDQRTVLSESH